MVDRPKLMMLFSMTGAVLVVMALNACGSASTTTPQLSLRWLTWVAGSFHRAGKSVASEAASFERQTPLLWVPSWPGRSPNVRVEAQVKTASATFREVSSWFRNVLGSVPTRDDPVGAAPLSDGDAGGWVLAIDFGTTNTTAAMTASDGSGFTRAGDPEQQVSAVGRIPGRDRSAGDRAERRAAGSGIPQACGADPQALPGCGRSGAARRGRHR
jgi:hypothetical protein